MDDEDAAEVDGVGSVDQVDGFGVAGRVPIGVSREEARYYKYRSCHNGSIYGK